MSNIFFDLEWNQGYPRSEAEKIDEIIQIGAYRLGDWQEEGTPYSAYVRPSIHKRLHHQVRKMVPLDQNSLKRAGGFRQVAADFFRWCGKDARFFTWGTSDARVLDTNLCWYGMEEYLDIEIYDLQRAFDLLVLHTCNQTALETAVTVMGLESELEYHDAGNDAAYTARIGAELVRRFGSLPDEAELERMELEIRARQRAEAGKAAEEGILQLLEQEPVVSHKCSHFHTVDDCLKSRGARAYHCPECDNWLCGGNWYRVGQAYVSRSRCVEHGRYYAVLTFRPQRGDRLQGLLRVYPEEQFTVDLFQLCRQGGERIDVCQMPRKRRRIRGRRPKTPQKN